MAEAKKKAHKESEAPKKKATAPKATRKKKAAPETVKPEARPEAKPEAAAPKPVAPPKPHAAVRQPKTPKLSGPKYYGTGRRKEAIAKVWLTPGSGKVMVNGKDQKQYFCGRQFLEAFISRPFAATQTQGKYDVQAEAYSGGVPSQANAVGLGIARALVQMNPDLKVLLKRLGLLTRDPRMKERKKYGLKRARRAFQYTKR